MLDPRYAAIIEDCADELASVVGRSVSEIREIRLRAEDFQDQVLEIEFEDRSTARLNWAFFVESQSKKRLAYLRSTAATLCFQSPV